MILFLVKFLSVLYWILMDFSWDALFATYPVASSEVFTLLVENIFVVFIHFSVNKNERYRRIPRRISLVVSSFQVYSQCWLYAINCKYSQACSNDHLYKTIIRLWRSTLGPPKPIPVQSFLYKTTTCLTRPATTFFVSQMKKKLSKTKTTTTNYVRWFVFLYREICYCSMGQTNLQIFRENDNETSCREVERFRRTFYTKEGR